jgi:branched-chain amino acid transport system ATP-binding protein
MSLLALDRIGKSFRGVQALRDVSFTVEAGTIAALIGPNGAGKTTCFNLIAGSFPPDAGHIDFAGKSIDGRRADQICRAGIGRTFQIVRPFNALSVLDNVVIGALCGIQDMRQARTHAGEVLELLHLDGKAGQSAQTLTLPERKRLEVARALATGPRLLLLDEVMAGLRPTEIDEMIAIFTRLNRETGLTILLVEHVMRAVMALARQVVVLHHGEVICRGTPDQVVRDPAVIESYLGSEAP